jgi:hypothetical protein
MERTGLLPREHSILQLFVSGLEGEATSTNSASTALAEQAKATQNNVTTGVNLLSTAISTTQTGMPDSISLAGAVGNSSADPSGFANAGALLGLDQDMDLLQAASQDTVDLRRDNLPKTNDFASQCSRVLREMG